MSSRTPKIPPHCSAISPTTLKNSRGIQPRLITAAPQSLTNSLNGDVYTPDKNSNAASEGTPETGRSVVSRGDKSLNGFSPNASQTGNRRSSRGNNTPGTTSHVISCHNGMQPSSPSKKLHAPMLIDEHLKVFVRMRSFTDRERDNLVQALNISSPRNEDGCDTNEEYNPLLDYQSHSTNFNIDDIIPLRMKDSTCEVTVPERGSFPFSFDDCFWSNKDVKEEDKEYASQETLFEQVGRPLVDNALQGFNSSIIAYGQTGSGKTYSIFGPNGPKSNSGRGALASLDSNSDDMSETSSYCRREELGLIPRVCDAIFAKLRGHGPNGTISSVHVSIVEIYLEEVYDLLNSRKRLAVRQDSLNSFVVVGSRQVPVQSYPDVLQLIELGDTLKTCAKTAINDRSSRAHTFFQLELETITETGKRTAKVLLADLAGCERIKIAKTDKGTALDEACNINLSLLTLGTCIEAAVQKAKQGKSIEHMGEFRQSTLTKLLKEFICGNSRTAMLVTVAPTVQDVNLTLQALRFADRAKQIQTHAVINHVPQSNPDVVAESIRQAYEIKKTFLDRECELEMGFDIAKRRYVSLYAKQTKMLEEQRTLMEKLSKRTSVGSQMTSEEVRSTNARLTFLDTELRTIKRMLSDTEREKDSLQTKLLELCNEAVMYTEKEALADQAHRLRLELEVVKDEMAEDVVANHIEEEQYKSEIQSLKDELLDTKTSKSVEVSNLQQSLARVMELSNKKVSLLEETVTARDQKLGSSKDEFAAVSVELENLKLHSEENSSAHNRLESEYVIEIENLNAELGKIQSAFDAQKTAVMLMLEENTVVQETYDIILNKFFVGLYALELSDYTRQKADICIDALNANYTAISNAAEEKWDNKCLEFESEIEDVKEELVMLQDEAQIAASDAAEKISTLEEGNEYNSSKHADLLEQIETARETHAEEIARLQEEQTLELSALVDKLEGEKKASEQLHNNAIAQKDCLSADLAHQCEKAKNTLETALQAFHGSPSSPKKVYATPQRDALYSIHFADGSPMGNSTTANMARKSIMISEKLSKITEKLKL